MKKQKPNPLWRLSKHIAKIDYGVKTIVVETSKGWVKIYLREILYIEAWGKFSKFYSAFRSSCRVHISCYYQ